MSKDIALRIKCSKLKLRIFYAEKPGHSFSFSKILFSEHKSILLCTAVLRLLETAEFPKNVFFKRETLGNASMTHKGLGLGLKWRNCRNVISCLRTKKGFGPCAKTSQKWQQTRVQCAVRRVALSSRTECRIALALTTMTIGRMLLASCPIQRYVVITKRGRKLTACRWPGNGFHSVVKGEDTGWQRVYRPIGA